MDLSPFFKSIVEQDDQAIVVCDTMHTVIYMNPAAVEEYNRRGGANIVGMSLFDCHNPQSGEKIRKVVDWFAKDKDNNVVHTFYNEKRNMDFYMVALRDDSGELIGYYEKHAYRGKDTMPFYDMGEE